MKPLITFGQANEFGFDVNPASQLVVLHNAGDGFKPAPITDDALREISHHGGVNALVETLNKLKRAPKEEKPVEKEQPAEEVKEEAETPKIKTGGRKKKGK